MGPSRPLLIAFLLAAGAAAAAADSPVVRDSATVVVGKTHETPSSF